ncbi:MAG: FlgD immunoglobulin-like domain containing protein, partial [bacterium]
ADSGTALPECLVVQILDAVDQPAKNYPVRFRILSGGGKLANDSAQVQVNTDGNGYAKTQWTLGKTAGEQKVEVLASFNGKGLRNTPLVFKATAKGASTVGEDAGGVPQRFALHQNFPNPFNPETTIQFDLPEAGQVEMNVYDMNGRHVRQLLSTQMPAKSHRLIWNGQDDNGRTVDSGIYFLVLRAQMNGASGALVATRKVVLMK